MNDAEGETEEAKCIVVESKARQSTGERTWRAEISVPKANDYQFGGKSRTMCIRGPLRVDKEQAYKDKDRLEQCAKEHPGDISKVKGMAREMLNSKTH